MERTKRGRDRAEINVDRRIGDSQGDLGSNRRDERRDHSIFSESALYARGFCNCDASRARCLTFFDWTGAREGSAQEQRGNGREVHLVSVRRKDLLS